MIFYLDNGCFLFERHKVSLNIHYVKSVQFEKLLIQAYSANEHMVHQFLKMVEISEPSSAVANFYVFSEHLLFQISRGIQFLSIISDVERPNFWILDQMKL